MPAPPVPIATAPPSALASMVAESSADTVMPLLLTELLSLIEADTTFAIVLIATAPSPAPASDIPLAVSRDGERRSDADRIDAGRLDRLDRDRSQGRDRRILDERLDIVLDLVRRRRTAHRDGRGDAGSVIERHA